MQPSHIRNFCIVAHVDHGKSTLADRLLEATQTVETRQMKPQLLDQLDLERERGITIKLAPVRMRHSIDGKEYILNLIDTPGHADFSYEVSRSLAAVEGAILLVDATQGIQAQTLTTLYQALDQGLTIIPAVNKIDLPQADVEGAVQDVAKLIGVAPEIILRVSGKSGQGIDELLAAVVERIPAPAGSITATPRALIFDSNYDPYRGVIALARVVDGTFQARTPLRFMATGAQDEALEVGTFAPKLTKASQLSVGEIGYIVTGLKEVAQARVGDTITLANASVVALPGYKEPTPMVFAGFYPGDGGEIEKVREALGKLKLNDSALVYEPTSSKAFGLGFRLGFLGLLHLEIIKERLDREYNLDLIVTIPSVAYRERPNGSAVQYAEPWVMVEIVTPETYIGPLMDLAQSRRGLYKATEYLGILGGLQRVILRYEMPLAELITNFYDELKSRSSGYASMSYEFLDYREEDLVRLDVILAEEIIDALSQVVHRTQAERKGRELVKRLKDLIPRQMFEVKIQAAIGGKVVARENLSALKKDVTGYLYGGDITRKRKLWDKQKKGKKRMKSLGRVEVPSDVFVQLLKQE